MHSGQIDLLAPAIVKVQGAIKHALKDSQSHYAPYADLYSVWSAIREALQSNDVAVLQMLDNIDGTPSLTTVLLHKSGQLISGSMPLLPPKNDPQAMGSYITYMRRYALGSVLGVIPADDDGEAAMREPEQETLKRADESVLRQQLATDIAYIVGATLSNLGEVDKKAMKEKLNMIAEGLGYGTTVSIASLSGEKLEKIAESAANESAMIMDNQ